MKEPLLFYSLYRTMHAHLDLRLLTEFFMLVSAIFVPMFNLKIGRSLNNCFSYRNVLQLASKMVLKDSIFLSKSSKLCAFRTIRYGSNFASMWSKYLSSNVWKDLRLPVPVLQRYHGRVLTSNWLQEFIFQSGILCYHYWHWHWKSKFSPNNI